MPPGGGGPVASVATAQASFTFSFPKPDDAVATTGGKRPAYISSATKSISFHLTDSNVGGTDTYASLPASLKAVQSANVANVTGNPSVAGQCGPDPSNGGNVKCTEVFVVPVGTDTVTIASYDALNATGNVLSQQIKAFAVVEGVSNAFTATLDAAAASVSVSGTGGCQSGTIGASFSTVGTSPVTFNVATLDAASKTIVAPGVPTLAVTATGVTGGAIGVAVNQSTQTFTLTPSTTGVSGNINVTSTPANSSGGSDGLAFTRTKSFTFANGVASPPNFLAVTTGAAGGNVMFFTVALGGSGSADGFSGYSTPTLAVTNSTNLNIADVDNPWGLAFDSSGDLLIANTGAGGVDVGNFACVPAGAIASGSSSSNTVTTNVDVPFAIGYDARDGSAAVANKPPASTPQMAEFTQSGSYAASATRKIVASGYGAPSVIAVPGLSAGTYAAALTDGVEADPAHGTGKSKVALLSAAGVETDITDASTFGIDIPVSLAWDGANSQLVIANNSSFHKLVAFYNVSPVSQVKLINTGRRNTYVAVSPSGSVAVAGTGPFGYPQVQVYDGTAARTPIGGPIPFNGTTTSCGSTYIYGNATLAVVNSVSWLSATKLLVALSASTGNGLYVFDTSVTAVPAGFDDVSCSAFVAAPKQTGFLSLAGAPRAAAFKP